VGRESKGFAQMTLVGKGSPSCLLEILGTGRRKKKKNGKREKGSLKQGGKVAGRSSKTKREIHEKKAGQSPKGGVTSRRAGKGLAQKIRSPGYRGSSN